MALQSTLTGPRPVLAPMMDDAVTILRSDQFIVGPSAVAGVALRDETGKPTDFPLLMVQPTLANRAAPPNGVVFAPSKETSCSRVPVARCSGPSTSGIE